MGGDADLRTDTNRRIRLKIGVDYADLRTDTILPKKIDDRSVYLLGRPVSMVYVSPGKHRLELNVSFGNSLRSVTASDPVVLEVDVRAGQAYQILYERKNIEDGHSVVGFALVNVGSVSKVNEYIHKNASYQKGEPFPKMGSLAKNTLINKSVNNTDHLNAKPSAVSIVPVSKPTSPSRTPEPVLTPPQGEKGAYSDKGHPWSPVDFEM